MVYRSSCVKAALAKISWHQNHKLMSHSPKHPYSPWIWRSCRAHPVQAGTPTVPTSEKIIDWRGTVIGELGEPTQWWWEYINSLTAALSTRLVPRLATDLSLLEPPVTEASKCPTCQPRALSEMIEFSKYLE
ncbi:hypothetical protein C2E23DRAFT_3650 [Lenzites betulinus]|nr:hypothetical protein C2E23DRAFT_3650 [Lenzites betulinus]